MLALAKAVAIVALMLPDEDTVFARISLLAVCNEVILSD
ncbi:hypothetical protein UF75_1263 [Desulfosporosinus sp. I2]|nr:hypothetical protein UF75_1263 [Desulfosporosinus sp. I2]